MPYNTTSVGLYLQAATEAVGNVATKAVELAMEGTDLGAMKFSPARVVEKVDWLGATGLASMWWPVYQEYRNGLLLFNPQIDTLTLYLPSPVRDLYKTYITQGQGAIDKGLGLPISHPQPNEGESGAWVQRFGLNGVNTQQKAVGACIGGMVTKRWRLWGSVGSFIFVGLLGFPTSATYSLLVQSDPSYTVCPFTHGHIYSSSKSSSSAHALWGVLDQKYQDNILNEGGTYGPLISGLSDGVDKIETVVIVNEGNGFLVEGEDGSVSYIVGRYEDWVVVGRPGSMTVETEVDSRDGYKYWKYPAAVRIVPSGILDYPAEDFVLQVREYAQTKAEWADFVGFDSGPSTSSRPDSLPYAFFGVDVATRTPTIYTAHIKGVQPIQHVLIFLWWGLLIDLSFFDTIWDLGVIYPSSNAVSTFTAVQSRFAVSTPQTIAGRVFAEVPTASDTVAFDVGALTGLPTDTVVAGSVDVGEAVWAVDARGDVVLVWKDDKGFSRWSPSTNTITGV
ncbi:hypothetical protein HDV00_005496 [Rhizophlyctis rosea]|nr:hypothetical protein HDV00_005496 [Rhizophlyctis rosea]